MYSLIGSAKMNGVAPREYLATALKSAMAGETIPLPHQLINQD
jgi:hypothetical protein